MILHTLSHGQPIQPWRALARPVSLSLSLLLAGCMGEGSLDVSSGDTVGAFQSVHELTQTHCSACHSEHPTAVDIPPKHAHSDTRLALKEVQNNGLINVNKPELSRLYKKLRDEQHQCWTDCPTSASQMLSAIQAFVNGAAMDNTPANNALKLASVPVVFRAAAGGGADAVQTTTVAHYALTEGSGAQAADTSNFEKPLNLTVSGAQWASGGGLAFSGAQGEKASVFGFDVAKIYDNTVGSKGTGAYSVETWFIPGSVAEGTRGYIWNYGATSLDVNVALAQAGASLVLTTKGDGASGLNEINLGVQVEAGTPYHVAVTHAAGTGFRVFVNGQALGLTAQDPGVTRWNRLAQLVLGNSSSGGTPWTGTLKTFAFHRTQLPADVIASHYSAGQDRFAVNDAPVILRFNITDLVNIPNTYIEMQGREYDAESYFFHKPTVYLGGAGSFRLKGLRIAINGDVQVSAQAYAKLDTQVTQNGQVLSELGTIMRKQDGPTADMIALAFETIGNQQNAWVDPEPAAAVSPKAQASTELGLPMFDAIYYNLASALGVSPMNRTVRNLYDGLKTQLPTTSDAMSLNAGIQTAITKLSTQFCSEMIADNAARQALFGNVNLGNNANQAFAAGSRDVFYRPLYDRLVVGGDKQPTYEDVAAELDVLVDQLLGANVNSTNLLAGVCAAVAASAPTYIHD